MSVRIMISEDGFKALNEVFSIQKEFGPFVKSPDPNDLEKALKLMEIGKENGSSKFTKPILFNIIKALLIQQKWAEKVEGEIENKEDEPNSDDENEEVKNMENIVQKEEKSKKEKKSLNVNHVQDNENDQNGEGSEKTLNVNNERKNVHSNMCKLYRVGKCKYGMRGKTKDKRGNTCQFEHPPICQKFRMFEKNPEKGCLEKECDKLHYNFCKWYHDCKNKEDCKFYHPKQGKQTKPMRSNNQNSFQPREGSRPERRFEYNNRDSSEKTNFLGHRYPPQVTSRVWENQDHQYKQTGPENMREQRLRDILSNMENMFQQAKSIMQ